MVRAIKVVRLSCQYCNKQYETRSCWAKRGSKFCSAECQRVGRVRKSKTYVNLGCDECGIIFIRLSSQAGRGIGNYCSIRCMSVSRGRLFAGKNHPNWKGGISSRTYASRVIIKRAKELSDGCEKCGSYDDLHGHHREHWARNNNLREDISNIEVICAKCHANEHPSLSGMLLTPPVRSGAYISCLICDNKRYIAKYLIGRAKYCSKECQLGALHAQARVNHPRKKKLNAQAKV